MNPELTAEQAEARLAELADGPRDAPERLQALNDLAWTLRANEPERAYELCREVIESAERTDSPLQLGWALRTHAFLDVFSAHVRRSLSHAERALEVFEELDDEAGQASVTDVLATAYEFLGDHSTGMEYALRSLELSQALGNERGVGWALSSIGAFLSAAGDERGALERLSEALALFEHIEHAGGVGRLCMRIGRLHLDHGRPEVARPFFERLLEQAELQPGRVFVGPALALLGEVHEAVGDLEKAREALEEGIRRSSSRILSGAGIAMRVDLGRVQLKTGRTAEARATLDSALEQARAAGVVPVETRIRALLADLAEQEGKPEEALSHLRAYAALRERTSDAEARTKLERMKVRMEVDAAKKDAEIHRLRFVELEQMQAQLIEAGKLAVLGNLAAGIAHEINSPLGVIRSNLDVSGRLLERIRRALEDRQTPVEPLLQAVDTTRRTTDEALARIGDIVGGLKRFTQLDEAEHRPLDLAASVRSLLAMFEPTVPDRIRLETKIRKTPPVWGNPGQLNQVFVTLLSNAVESIDDAGVVRIETDCEPDGVLIRISDTGRGMPPEQVERLFETGFSQRDTRVRFRVGLPAAAATVRQHGGRIRVESTPGAGTTLCVRLPRHAG